MSETSLLLKAYYEALYERLQANKELLSKRIDELLVEEITERGFEDFDEAKYAAYKDACLAFVDERIELYNPFGIQYTFDRTRAKEAFELELQLDWYDSRAEFFADFGRNPCLWVKIGGWYVILQCLGNVDKIKTSKNEHKLT